MGSRAIYSLALGTALALLWTQGASYAQTAQKAHEPAADQAEETKPKNGKSTLLERIDIGAGAQGTAGTDVIAVTPEEMDRKKPADLSEIFAGEPEVAVGGAIPSTQKIYVHGVDETNLAVTVDGSRQNNKVFHHNGTYLIDPALLKAVNVQAGVAPADAGPAALGGSMGFETKDAADLLEEGRNHGGFVTGSWDTNSRTHVTGAAAYGRVSGFEYLGYLNYSGGQNFTAGNGMVMPGTSTNLLSGLLKLAYETESGHRFELSHERVSDDALRPYRANGYVLIGLEPVVRRYDLDRQNTVFTYTTTAPTDWWDPKVVLAYSKTRVETPFFNRRNGAQLADSIGNTESFNGKAENKFSFDLGTVTTGFDFYSDRAHFLYADTPPEVSAERAFNVGAYAQARLEPTDRSRLSFGARFDNQTFTGVNGMDWNNSGISGNLSGEYDIVPDFLTAKAGVSSVWGGIALAENFIQIPTWTYANPPVASTSTNVTAGLVATYNGFTAEVGVFRTAIDNVRFPTTPDASRALDLRTRGWDAGIGYQWDSGFVRAKYSSTDATVDGSPADSDVGRYMTTPLGEVIMITAAHKFQDWGLTIGGDAEIALPYYGTMTRHPLGPTTPKRPLAGYEVFNAFVEYVPPSNPNLTVRADVRNILDETYSNRAAWVGDFAGYTPHLDPGRSFRLSATVRF